MKKYLLISMIVSCSLLAMQKPFPPRAWSQCVTPPRYFPSEKNKLHKFIVTNPVLRSILNEQLKSISIK